MFTRICWPETMNLLKIKLVSGSTQREREQSVSIKKVLAKVPLLYSILVKFTNPGDGTIDKISSSKY